MHRTRIFTCFWLVISALATQGLLRAQTAKESDASLIQALLAEVRALRIAIEKSNVAGPRMQLAVARYQMQQERVQSKERDLEVVRNQIGTESIGRDRMQAAARQFDDLARQTADAAQRKQYEEAANQAKYDIEQQAQREQQARAREAALLGDLRLEQAKLSEMANQLDQLDKSLGPR